MSTSVTFGKKNSGHILYIHIFYFMLYILFKFYFSLMYLKIACLPILEAFQIGSKNVNLIHTEKQLQNVILWEMCLKLYFLRALIVIKLIYQLLILFKRQTYSVIFSNHLYILIILKFTLIEMLHLWSLFWIRSTAKCLKCKTHTTTSDVLHWQALLNPLWIN